MELHCFFISHVACIVQHRVSLVDVQLMNEQVLFIIFIVKTASCLVERTVIFSRLDKYIAVAGVGSPEARLCRGRGAGHRLEGEECSQPAHSLFTKHFSWASGSISTTAFPESPGGSTKHIFCILMKTNNNFCLPPKKGLINVCDIFQS